MFRLHEKETRVFHNLWYDFQVELDCQIYHLRFMYFSEDDDIIDDSSTDSEEERRRKRKEKKRKMEKSHEKKFSEFHFTSSSLHTWSLDEMLIRVNSYPIQLNKLLTSPFCLFPKVTKRKKTG